MRNILYALLCLAIISFKVSALNEDLQAGKEKLLFVVQLFQEGIRMPNLTIGNISKLTLQNLGMRQEYLIGRYLRKYFKDKDFLDVSAPLPPEKVYVRSLDTHANIMSALSLLDGLGFGGSIANYAPLSSAQIPLKNYSGKASESGYKHFSASFPPVHVVSQKSDYLLGGIYESACPNIGIMNDDVIQSREIKLKNKWLLKQALPIVEKRINQSCVKSIVLLPT